MGVGGGDDGVALAASVGVGTWGAGTSVDELVTVGAVSDCLASGGVTGITAVQAARASDAMNQAKSFALSFSDTFTDTHHGRCALT